LLLADRPIGSVWKTVDGGGSWKNITGDFPKTAAGHNGNYPWSQANYDEFIGAGLIYNAGTGSYDDIVFVGLLDVVLSVNASGHWVTIGGPVYSPTNAVIHSDQHAIAFNPNNWREILIGNDGGINKGVLAQDGSGYVMSGLNANLAFT